MKRTALWIVGPPAAGKTTLARRYLGDDATEITLIAKPKWTIARGGLIVAAGHYTGQTFDGADMVSYNGMRAALEFWRDHLRPVARLTIFDGDRFSYAGAVEFVRPYVDRVKVIHVTAAPDVLAARRVARGWHPNPHWLKGRETKAMRFAEAFK